MGTLVIVKSAYAFSSIIKIKLRFNLRDTMYFQFERYNVFSSFFFFLPSPEKKKDWGRENEKMAHVNVYLLK